MASIPALANDAVNVTNAAQRLSALVTLDALTRSVVCVAGGDIWVGTSAVTTSGATEGFKFVSGDELRFDIDSPGANDVWFIASVNPTTMRVEQYGA